MAGLKLMTNGGYVPRVAPHLLADNEAQKAVNTKLYSGVLRSWRKPKPVFPIVTVPSTAETIYKGLKTSGDDLWLSWSSEVDVVSSPLESASPMMIFYTGDGVPKKTNSVLAGSAQGGSPANWYKMGVSAPVAAPTLQLGTNSLGSIEVTNGGSGYQESPAVTFSGGGGSGAAASATVINGVVTELVITSTGSGYTSAPTVSIAGGGGSGATATAAVGFVQYITVTNGGTGYTSAPTVTISGTGTGATATAYIRSGVVVGVLITNKGSGYTSAPTIGFSGGGGSGATATATVTSGLAKLTVTAGGSAYGPVVTFSGGGGTGAVAKVVVRNGAISAITLEEDGTGYTSEPTVTISGGAGTGATAVAKFKVDETRLYVYTYINAFGDVEEEGAPSPVSDLVNVSDGQQVVVSGFSAPPSTGYNITKKRIYRSVSGSGATTFLFVAEIPVNDTSFTDDIKSAGLGEALETLAWEEPPADLAGLVALPNGFLAGFSDETVYFSEVNRPHAWPSAYGVSVGQKIVGLGVFGQSVAVMTKGYPYVISGVSPDSMSAEKLSILEPCIAKGSITSDVSGVTYASPNGLCVIGPGQAGVVTNNILLRDDFAKYAPTTIQAKHYAGKYFGFFTGGTGDVEKGAFILDQTLAATPLSLITINTNAAFVDIDTADMFLVVNNEICRWEGDENNTLPYEWVSKKFVMSAPANFGAIEVDADFGNLAEGEALQARVDAIIAANQALWASNPNLLSTLNTTKLDNQVMNGSILGELPVLIDDRYLLVEVYCDDRKVHSSQYTASGVYRMPSGFKGQRFVVKINGNIELRYVKMAESVKELKTL